MAGIGLNRSRQAPAQETPSFGSIAERFRRAGDLDRAIALCQEGLKKFPNQLSARVTLGWALLDKGEYDLARQELERVIRRAPDNLAAIRGLAELHDRAEHSVTGLGPDGVWTPPEEVEPAGLQFGAESATGLDAGDDAVVVTAAEQSDVPLPLLPVAQAADDVDPRSLIETPAQAAVAHAGAPLAETEAEVEVSAFENVLERTSEAEPAADGPPSAGVELPEPESRAADDAASAIETVADLTTLDEPSAWEDPAPSIALEAEPVLFAENGDIELARVASELVADAIDTPPVEPIIDLPVAEDALEGAFLQFEEAVADTAAPEGVALLDAEDVSTLEEDSLDPELLPALDVEMPLVAAVAPDASLEPEPHESAEQGAVPSLAAEVAVTDTVTGAGEHGEPPAEWGRIAEPTAEFIVESRAPVETERGEAELAAESPAEVPRTEAEAARALEANPAAEVSRDSVALPEPVAAAEPEAVPLQPDVLPEVGTETPIEAARAPEPPAEVQPEPAVPVEPPSVFAPVVENHRPDLPDEVDADDPAAPPASREADDRFVDLPGLAAAAAVQVSDADADIVSAPEAAAAGPARDAQPVAALEAFLRKIGTRRLHLTPGSVA